MNDRIKVLVEQSGGFACSQDEWGFYNEDLEKFVNLIVKECMELNRQELSFTAHAHLCEQYAKHFEIKE